jgi:hypothetical protein
MPSAESVFRELNARLDLPARRRALLLRELRADFEDLVTTLVAEGLTAEAAQQKAFQMLTPSSDDAGVLSGLHRTRYARLVSGYRAARVHVVERVSIGAMAALAVGAPLFALARSSGLPAGTLAVLGLSATLLLANLAWQAFRIVVRDDADADSLARAGLIQAALLGLTLSAGVLAVFVDAGLTLASWEAAGGATTLQVAAAMTRCAETASITLGLTILGVFGALALLQWHLSARTVEEELHALLSPTFEPEEE